MAGRWSEPFGLEVGGVSAGSFTRRTGLTLSPFQRVALPKRLPQAGGGALQETALLKRGDAQLRLSRRSRSKISLTLGRCGAEVELTLGRCGAGVELGLDRLRG
jgi:hypothetical protein